MEFCEPGREIYGQGFVSNSHSVKSQCEDFLLLFFLRKREKLFDFICQFHQVDSQIKIINRIILQHFKRLSQNPRIGFHPGSY
ncbi:MAG TPA: hypothetical protein VFX17_03490 [Patescibacteria group bacterium]|nr:hypothetical protein [Patescibacteria group bacterium]